MRRSLSTCSLTCAWASAAPPTVTPGSSAERLGDPLGGVLGLVVVGRRRARPRGRSRRRRGDERLASRSSAKLATAATSGRPRDLARRSPRPAARPRRERGSTPSTSTTTRCRGSRRPRAARRRSRSRCRVVGAVGIEPVGDPGAERARGDEEDERDDHDQPAAALGEWARRSNIRPPFAFAARRRRGLALAPLGDEVVAGDPEAQRRRRSSSPSPRRPCGLDLAQPRGDRRGGARALPRARSRSPPGRRSRRRRSSAGSRRASPGSRRRPASQLASASRPAAVRLKTVALAGARRGRPRRSIRPASASRLQLGVDLAVARGPEEARRVVDELLDLIAATSAAGRASRGSRRRSGSAPYIGQIYQRRYDTDCERRSHARARELRFSSSTRPAAWCERSWRELAGSTAARIASRDARLVLGRVDLDQVGAGGERGAPPPSATE